jgi:hypothetical protein
MNLTDQEKLRNELSNALNADENDLLALIGYYSNTQLDSSPIDKNELMELGKQWIDENLAILRVAICKNQLVQDFKSKDETFISLGMIILDALIQMKLQLPLIPVSAWICKKGITNICRD